jgi:hypothetical protein
MQGGWNLPKGDAFQMTFEAVFENARVVYDIATDPTLLVLHQGGDVEHPPLPVPDVEIAAEGGNLSGVTPHYSELCYFIDCVVNQRKPETVTPQQAAESVWLVEQELLSAKENRLVEL